MEYKSNNHISVLLNECIDYLNIKPEGIYLDGTLGMGGHSIEIAKRLTTGKLICVDKDDFALNYSKERLSDFNDKIIYVKSDFKFAADIIDSLNYNYVDGLIFDLGVSSPQLDDSSRGFSYINDAKLDMRMDNTSNLSAFDVVNSFSEDDLVKILFEYGEERYSRIIVKDIVRYRNIKPIDTTLELVEIIKGAMPSQALREKQHPAKRTFQAIRIAVNDELNAISTMLDSVPDKMKIGARLCVISFHSLEDRIVKNKIASKENGCTCPREAPICTCGFKQTLKNVSRKAILPTNEEIELNPRSRSAKLRVAERV